MTTAAFSSLDLHGALLKNLDTLGYTEMTPIQARSLPPILTGEDVIGQGKTGSGKTAAFGLGVLQKLEPKRFHVQALILCPTRELADQVAKEIRRLARALDNIKVLTLCGGMPFGPQVNSLEHGAHIIVGTPGRVEEHVAKGNLKLSAVTSFVLDEADRMLDMGFQPSLDAIAEFLPIDRQTLLFSATFPPEIEEIASKVMMNPVVVKVESRHDESTIEQHYHQVEDSNRLDAVRALLLQHRPDSAVVFCNTRRETQEVADALQAAGFSAQALHGDLEQKVRDLTLVRFAGKSISVLVATDVAARGLDIDALDAVINFHIPRDLEVHVHRIGRTGRAGSRGFAATLFSDKEKYKLAKLEAMAEYPIEITPLPARKVLDQPTYKPPMATLQIDGGKKQKVRPGDILGALTGEGGIAGDNVGKIHIFDNWSAVAVRRAEVQPALRKLSAGKMKGRNFRVRVLGEE